MLNLFVRGEIATLFARNDRRKRRKKVKKSLISLFLAAMFVLAILTGCKADPTTPSGPTSGPGLQPQSTGAVIPDCPNGPEGRGAGGCTKAEEGQKCQARNPDMVLVCKSCFRLDERTAANTAFVNPNCK